MKKLLLLTLGAVMGLCANAQSLKLTSNGTEVKDGDRVDITGMYTIEYGSLIIDPKLTLTSTNAGVTSLDLELTDNECSPELNGEDDDFWWLNGVGEPQVQICSPIFADGCTFLSLGKPAKFTSDMSAGQSEDLQIELSYQVGSSVKVITDVNIKASFTVKIAQGGETLNSTFYVDTDKAGIACIEADDNAPAEYFDLQGRKVEQPTSGLYIKRQGSKASKVIL